ncbi:MAG: 4-hydroxy-tetrahydrodipicolinate reductase [Treponema sp.]|nr:4-hydroxy-tetrahydrodipicolinate reductase [Treponema sp.]
MNIAIVGYGKMGRMIESLASGRGHTIAAAVDPFAESDKTGFGSILVKNIADLDGIELNIDCAIEFTRPDTAAANILALAERRIPVVVGTTGWYETLAELSAAVNNAGSSLLWASNFSLGVNLFYRICWYAAELMDSFPEYDPGGFESHHNKKIDSPSGTAKTLVEGILKRMKRKTKPVWNMLDRPPGSEELHFASLRLGAVPGEHSLIFDSSADSIEIRHSARNREGLASGALISAEWLAGSGVRRNGVFTFDDVLEEHFNARNEGGVYGLH